jgi:hypothetical protein
MNARLRALDKDFAGARVDRFGFFFPSAKASGDRIEFTPDQLRAGGDVLGRLARIAASGSFLATNNAAADCGFCDYRQICGNVVEVAYASQRKLANPANTTLEPYTELRNRGKAND